MPRGPVELGVTQGCVHSLYSSCRQLRADMTFSIETEPELDGRWIAEVEVLPGVMAYGTTKTDAVAKVQALALRVLAERLEQGEAVPELLSVSFQAA